MGINIEEPVVREKYIVAVAKVAGVNIYFVFGECILFTHEGDINGPYFCQLNFFMFRPNVFVAN